MAETTPEKEHDVLDDIKLAEKQMKMALLMKNIKTMKEFAREVLIQKEKMIASLEEMGMNESEQKRVIDFINSLVALTKREKENIHDEIRENFEETKDKIEKKVQDDPLSILKNFGYGGLQQAYIATQTSASTLNGFNPQPAINHIDYKAEDNSAYNLLSNALDNSVSLNALTPTGAIASRFIL